MKPGLSQCREEQIRPCETPDDLAFGACSNPSCKQCCCSSVDRAGPAAGKFVESALRQPAARQDRVDLLHAERQAAGLFGAFSFNRRDALA